METVLLAWNPKRWNWTNLDDACEQVRRTGICRMTWSCGTRKTISPGSRFFLIRLGLEPKGIVGAGRIVSAPFETEHWDATRDALGETGWFVDVEFDSLSKQPLVSWQELRRPPLAEMHWATQMSGVKIPAPQAAALEATWQTVSTAVDIAIPEEILTACGFWEGASKRILVNVYERDSNARALCLQHHGSKCCVCGFDFGQVYGTIAARYIHVHHLIPLSKIKKGYTVDPLKDLRPVCPNCHAVIHLRRDPFTIEEVQQLIRRAS